MDLNYIGQDLLVDLRSNLPYLNDGNVKDVTALCLAEEAGELLGAYRRYSGRARRKGSLDDVRSEMADVLLNVAMLAHLLEIELEDAVESKLDIIYSRGWKENNAPVSGS